MARHRHVKNLNYDEEYDAAFDDSIYGHSYDDDSFLSSSMERYMHKSGQDSGGLAGYMAQANIQEEDEYSDMDEDTGVDEDRRNSQDLDRPRLSSENEARLNSVLDSLRDVVGDTFSESVLVRTALNHNYDVEASLDALFKLETANTASKPPKQTKKVQKKKTDEFSYVIPQSYCRSSAFVFTRGHCEPINTSKLVRDMVQKVTKNHKPRKIINDSLKSYELQLLENKKNQLINHKNDQSPNAINKMELKPEKSESPIGSSLSALATQHIGKVQGSPVLKGSNFIIPRLKMNPDAPLKPVQSPKGSADGPLKNPSLFSLAQSHLSKVSGSNVVEIPKLGDPAKLSLKSLSLNPTKPISIPSMRHPSGLAGSWNSPKLGSSGSQKSQSIKEDGFDLTIALTKNHATDPKEPVAPSTSRGSDSMDTFDSLSIRLLEVDDTCMLEFLRDGPSTSFGEVLCKRLHKIPPSVPTRQDLNRLTHFSFETPSPDDIVKAALKDNKNRDRYKLLKSERSAK